MTHAITTHRTATEGGKKRWIPICSCGWVGGMAKTAETAQAVGEQDHVAGWQPPVPCPTPSKRRFRSRDTAEAEMRLFWRTSSKGKEMPTRVYECACGGWHTTSKPLRRRADA